MEGPVKRSTQTEDRLLQNLVSVLRSGGFHSKLRNFFGDGAFCKACTILNLGIDLIFLSQSYIPILGLHAKNI